MSNATSKFQILFVDASVPAYQRLLIELDASVRVCLLEGERDGVEQITAAIAQLRAEGQIGESLELHIISHGVPGCLDLGNAALSLDTLASYADDLAAWSASELLLYGCNVAAGDAGQEFVEKLARMTGGAIAASTTPIGHPSLGGNWDLDVSTQDKVPAVAISSAAQQTWQHKLGPFPEGPAMYQVLSGQLNILNVFTGGYEPIGQKQVAYNATGFNPVDNYIYGMHGNDVIRVHSDGSLEYTGIKADKSYSGAVDSQGAYWIRSNNTKFQKIDVTTGTVTNYTLNGVGFGSADMSVIAEANGDITFVGVNGSQKLLRVTIPAGSTTGTVTATNISGLSGFKGGYGAVWIDVNGNMFAFNNSSGRIIQIFDYETNSPSASLILQSTPNGSNDGMSSIEEASPFIVPIIDLDGDNSSGATGYDYQTTFTENGAPVGITSPSTSDDDADTRVISFDGGAIGSATVTLTNPQAGDSLNVGNLPPGFTAATTAGPGGEVIITLTSATGATPAEIEQAIEAISFNNNSEDPDATPRKVEVILADTAGNQGNVAISTINVVPVNDAPVALNDGPFTTAEETPLVISPVTPNDTDIEGDSLTIAEIEGNPITPGGAPVAVTGGTVSLAADGITLTFTPALDYNGSANFDYTISDGNGGTDTATVSLEVTPLNDPPVATDDLFTVAEDGTVNIPVLGNDIDVDGDVITISEVEGMPVMPGDVVPLSNGTGSVTVNSDGSLTFTPATNYNGPASFNYSISDGKGGTNTATVSGQVTPVNDAPVAANDGPLSMAEETPLTFSPVTPNDSDLDGDTLTITEIDGNPITAGGAPVVVTGGTVSLAADGITLTFNPDPDYNGSADFDYTISDGKGGTDSATVDLEVTPVNDAPVATDDSFITQEDGAVTIAVLNNDSDIDGDSLTVSAIDGTTVNAGDTVPLSDGSGTVTLNSDGSLTFTPAPNYSGPPATFNYTISDGQGGTSTATVVGTITPVNDAPVAVNDGPLSTSEDTPLVISPVTANDTDIDGDALTITEINGNGIAPGGAPLAVTGGTVSLAADGITLTFTPDPNYNGPADFDYTISDGNGGTDSATVDLAVTPVNDAPIATDDSFTTAEDGSVTIPVLGNDSDIDGDLLSVSAIEGTPVNPGDTVALNDGSGSVTVNPDGSLTFTPAPNYNGPANFDYSISDGKGGSDTATVTGTVTPVNDAPVAVNDGPLSTAEETPLVISPIPNDSDIDGDTLAITEVDGNAIAPGGSPVAVTGGTVSLAADGITLTFTPDPNYNGPVAFDYTISDGNGGTDSATIDLEVTPVNDAPVATNDGFSTLEDSAVTIPVLPNDGDIDGDVLSVSAIEGTPVNPGDTVVLNDGSGSVTVNPDGSLTFTPTLDYNGPSSFNYTVSDGQGGTDTATVSGIVTPVNDEPDAVYDGPLTTPEDTPLVISPLTNDTDADGDSLSITEIDGNPIVPGGAPVAVTGGTVSLASDGITLTFSPNPDYNGSADFDYTISDGNGGTNSTTVDLEVTPTNDPPAATNDSFIAAEDATVNIPVSSNDADIDGDFLIVSEIEGNAVNPGDTVALSDGSGTVTVNPDGSLTFTAATNYNGTSNFGYTISDGKGGTDTATVSGTITSVNDAPVAANDGPLTAVEDTPLVITPVANDSDSDGDPLTITEIDGNPITAGGAPVSVTGGTVSLDADGITLTFTPDPNYYGPADFNYTISDGNGGTDSATVDLTVTSVNDAPVAVDDSFSILEDTSVTIAVLGNDGDIDGVQLSISSVDGTAVAPGDTVVLNDGTGSVTVNIDGTLTFTPTPHYNGAASFNYSIIDSDGATSTATVTGAIAPVNDAPDAINDGPLSTLEDTPLAISPITNDVDIDGDALTITEVNGSPITPGGTPIAVTGGTVSLAGDGITLNFTPSPHYNGPADFDYTISDGQGGTDSATVNLTVGSVNDAPVAADDSFTTAEETSINIPALGNDGDIEGDPLSISAIESNSVMPGDTVALNDGSGSVTVNADGSLTFTPVSNYHGPATFEYSISDGNGGTDTATVTGTVTPVNDVPIASDDSFTTAEDGPVNIPVLANDSDIDNDILRVSEIEGTPVNPGDTVPLSDGSGSVTVNLDGSLTFNPAPHYHGPVNFDYTVSDGKGGTDNATVSGTVTSVNDEPVAVNDGPLTAVEDTPLVISPVTPNDSDVDGDILTIIEIDGNPITPNGNPVAVTGGTVSLAADGITLTFTPNANYNGPADFGYTISDGKGGSDTATVELAVASVNDAPVAVDDGPLSTAEDTPLVISPVTPNDSDLDGDQLTITEIDGNAIAPGGSPVAVTGGTVSLAADGITLTFTPSANYNGPADFGYTISDGKGGTDSATVDLAVTPVNDAPVAVNDGPLSTAEDAPLVISPVAANDSDLDGDSLTVTDIDGNPITPGGASVAVTGGTVSLDADGITLTFTPAPNYNGPADFAYSISDGQGGTDSATVDLTVTSTNDAPVAANDGTFVLPENTALTLTPLGNDSDLDGDPLTISEIDGNPILPGGPAVAVPGGTVSLGADGVTLTFTPDLDYVGPVDFDYTVSDGNGGTDIASIDLSVILDTDGDGIPDSQDLDDDNDGILDTAEGDGNLDTDGDGIVDSLDLDADNDGILDVDEAGHGAADSDGDGMVDGPTGANGLPDAVETGTETGVPATPPIDTDGDGIEDFQDLDSDNDGLNDVLESGGSDPDGDGIVGTGAPVDGDGDGINDVVDPSQGGTPVPVLDTDGDGVEDYQDLDSDNDGVNDVVEGGNAALDPDGNGTIDGPDGDGDGIQDPVDPAIGFGDAGNGDAPDSDGDGVEDYQDLDSDNDGINDVIESGNGSADSDGDGTVDGADGDGDGILDPVDPATGFGDSGSGDAPDSDGDGIDDILDLDSDNDGVPDVVEGGNGASDADGDGRVDGPDSDGDGIVDPVDPATGFGNPGGDGPTDSNGDGTPDFQQPGTASINTPGTGGADAVNGGTGDDILNGLSDTDTLDGGSGNDVINGGSDGDTAVGGAGNDVVNAGSDEDVVNTGEGDDIANGGSGDDSINGLGGNDLINGGSGNDTLMGGDGDDLLNGGSGNDWLQGGSGNDLLRGAAGDDRIEGGVGADTLFGGQGDDVFVYNAASEFGDLVMDFEIIRDRIDLTSLVPGDVVLGGNVQLQQVGLNTLVLVDAGAGFETVATLLSVNADTLDANNFLTGANAANGALTEAVAEAVPTANLAGFDILWRNSITGDNAAWQTTDYQVTGNSLQGRISDTNWEIEAVGDFNQDGNQDLLLRHQVDGINLIRHLGADGTTAIGDVALPAIPDTDWHFVGTGDFNQDGELDLVLRHQVAGVNLVWNLENEVVTSGTALAPIEDLNWQIEAIADFNQDGQSDLLLRHQTAGINLIRTMDGYNAIGDIALETVPDTNWSIEGARDLNGSGSADIVWRHGLTGDVLAWEMNGTQRVQDHVLGQVDLTWQAAV